MANNRFERISPGVYRDKSTGKTVKTPDGKAPKPENKRQAAPTPDAGRPAGNVPPPPAPNNANIIDQNQALAAQGGNIANNLLDTSQFASGQAFAPELAPRTITGNWGADRQAMEDAAYGNLTRGLDDQYARERQMMQDELVNSGNPVGSPKYEQQMQEFNRRYDDIRSNARGQAMQFGGQELDRAFSRQEGIIGNQLSQAESIRNQQVGEIGALSQLGIGNIETLQGIGLQRRQLNAAMNALNRGSGGGQQQSSGPSPVFSPTPYGYG